MSLNPYEHADTTPREWRDERVMALEGARVTSARSHTTGDDVDHHIRVLPDSQSEPLDAEILAGLVGDTTVPTEGDRVLVGYRLTERPIVLGSLYQASDTIPDFEPGERRIGHPSSDSYVRLLSDGSIVVNGANGNTVELAADGDVLINGGSTQAITDVQASGTNSEGGITGLDITRSPSVYIPSP